MNVDVGLLGCNAVCIYLHCLFDKGSFVILFVGSLKEIKSCMYHEISRMAFLDTSVSMFNSFIPSITKLETFVNNIVTNCVSSKKFPYKGMCYK
jgi:hypothetical protein